MELRYIDYDVETVTAGDYSVEFNIWEETYEHWKSNYYDRSNPMGENAQFKYYVWNEMENRINEIPDQGCDNDDEERAERKNIARIAFAYENSRLISLLKKRGKHIQTEKWK